MTVPASNSAAMIRTLGLVATLCGVLIVAAYQGTLPAVTANKKLALERAVKALIPDATAVIEYDASPTGIHPASGEPPAGAIRFYAAYDRKHQLKAIAAEGAARGYADVVRVLYGYDPQCQCVFGIRVVQMRETPGIGDKVLTDPAFLANFTRLDVSLASDLKAMANAVRTVKHGTKQHPWEIDAISGATITSKAIGRAINDNAQTLLPRLYPNLAALRNPSP